MKISVCITTFNEERSLGNLLDSLIHQTKKPNEIIIVDGGSTDGTRKIIDNYGKKYGNIRGIFRKCIRAKGRNLGVKLAKNKIIAITDAGCVVDKNWLKLITGPFKDRTIDIAAGFYRMRIRPSSANKMRTRNSFEKAESLFLGVLPNDFNSSFLPSTRSIAFTKGAWKTIGGFPERKENSAEDTDFNYQAIKLGMKYARVKNAIVEWGIPDNLFGFIQKIYSYAKWDAEYGIWWNPIQKFSSHNVKAIFVFLRYLTGLSLLAIFFISANPLFLNLAVLFFLFYLLWAFKKSGAWGIVLQLSCDFAVMAGFISGIISVNG